MNYQRIYDQLIEYRRIHVISKSNCYVEKTSYYSKVFGW